MANSVDNLNKRIDPNKRLELYNLFWPAHQTPVSIEMDMIKRGGQWTKRNGEQAGLGNFAHYKKLIACIWPEIDQHRWFDLILKEWTQDILLSLLGPKDASKTLMMSVIGLADYYCFPYDTLGIFTSTSRAGLELRIWGEVKSLHLKAKQRFDWLPGNPVDSMHVITTDDLSTERIRDLRRGLVCVGGDKVGEVVGIKQTRRRLYGDEFQHMKPAFLTDGLPNLNSGDFKGIFSGNPIGDGDALDKLAEPKEGWGSISEPEKTTVWNTRDIGGRCINLIGTDSPNFDHPQEPAPRYPYMINQKSIDRIVSRWGMNSFQYYRYA